MNILSYVLIALVASVPGLWIENYFVTNPIWWAVTLSCVLGNLFGYLAGTNKKKKMEASKDEQ